MFSDYELLDKLIPVLNQIQQYSIDDIEELIDIAKDHLNDMEFKLFKNYIIDENI